MNKHLLSLIVVLGLLNAVASVDAQTTKHVCATNEAWQQAILIDPSLVLRRQQAELQIEQYLKAQSLSRTTDEDSVRIIPAVVHVIHEGGVENISNAQIENAIRIFNQDYSRTNADTINTPIAFLPVAANPQIQFRLATVDPAGNCTNGIDRVYSDRTNLFTDFTKSIIDWPSDKYLNIWVTKTIGLNTAEKGAYVIGYAQFPLAGLSGTDGVVLEYDFVGDTILGQRFYAGRDGTHEIGHYFNLIHTWGDAVCGDDQCADTPTQDSADFGCPVYPHITCGNDGDMSDNYMDYSNGDCKDIFTLDQKARMRATLEVVRYSLWQPSNLAATGTADPYTYPPTTCIPQADFLPVHQSICPGSFIRFHDNSTNAPVTSWNWTFPGGSPPSSTLSSPEVTYNAQGNYHVTLTVTNENGSTTIDRGDVAVVDYNPGRYVPPFSEGFEAGFAPGDWHIFNDDGGPAWQQTNLAAYSGSYSMSVQNFETVNNTAPESVKELQTPAFDFTLVTQAVLTFRFTYGQQISSNTDTLYVDISDACGASGSWSSLYTLGSDSLAARSGGFQPGDYVPSSTSQWGLVTIPIPSAYEGKPNVKIMFQWVTGELSNNIYLDDVNITGVVGIDELSTIGFNFNVDPNPAAESFNLNYVLNHEENVVINLYDLQGRLIRQLENKHASPGTYTTRIDGRSVNLSSGLYMLRMITNDGEISKKLIYSKD